MMTDRQFNFDNPKQVSAATNPINLKILTILSTEQLNISEIATRLGITMPTANYHVRQLEDAVLVTRIGEDEEIGRDRQRYSAVANRFHLDDKGKGMTEAEWLRSIATYRRSFEEVVRQWELSTTGDWPSQNRLPRSYGVVSVKVSPARYKELNRGIAKVLNDFIAEEDYEGDDVIEGTILCLFFPSSE